MKAYARYKLRILRQMCIYVTIEQERHLKSLSSEIAMDNYARSLWS